MSMKVHRHELEHLSVLSDAAAKNAATTVICREGDGCDWSAAIVDGNGEAVADTKLGGFLE